MLHNLAAPAAATIVSVATGLNNGDIGDALHLAPSTVKTYVSRLLRKTDSRSRAQLAARAHEWGVVVG